MKTRSNRSTPSIRAVVEDAFKGPSFHAVTCYYQSKPIAVAFWEALQSRGKASYHRKIEKAKAQNI